MPINFHLISKESRAQSNLFFKSISAALKMETNVFNFTFFSRALLFFPSVPGMIFYEFPLTWAVGLAHYFREIYLV